MARCVLDNLVEAGTFSEEKLTEVNAISDMYSYAPIKSALNFGYLVRKTYLSYLEKNGYPLVDVRNEVLDESFVEQCDIKHLNSFLYLPLRKDTDGNLDNTDYTLPLISEQSLPVFQSKVYHYGIGLNRLFQSKVYQSV